MCQIKLHLKDFTYFKQGKKIITLKRNLEKVGKIFDVLIEGFSKQNQNDLFGRTTTNKVVNIKNLDEKILEKL